MGILIFARYLQKKYEFDKHMIDDEGWRALHCSARNGSLELVTYFTDLGSDIHLKTSVGWNCLHIAANYGHLNLCKELIEIHKFDRYMADNDGWTALHYPVRNGSYK